MQNEEKYGIVFTLHSQTFLPYVSHTSCKGWLQLKLYHLCLNLCITPAMIVLVRSQPVEDPVYISLYQGHTRCFLTLPSNKIGLHIHVRDPAYIPPSVIWIGISGIPAHWGTVYYFRLISNLAGVVFIDSVVLQQYTVEPLHNGPLKYEAIHRCGRWFF